MRIRQKLLGYLKPKWPEPYFDERLEPHFLFILTPPYSGSTVLAKLLNTSNRTMFLQENGEGQRLIPSFWNMHRWDPDAQVNYESVKAVWLNKYQSVNSLVGNIDVVVEKSPSNMVRIKLLSSLFRSFSFIANNRNPYASCASILYRNHATDSMVENRRGEILKSDVREWLNRSYLIKNLIDQLDIPLITYERFCEDPGALIELLKTPEGVAQSIDLDAQFSVKDYKPQGIISQNERQISLLNKNDITALNSELKDHEDIMAFFGYSIIS